LNRARIWYFGLHLVEIKKKCFSWLPPRREKQQSWVVIAAFMRSTPSTARGCVAQKGLSLALLLVVVAAALTAGSGHRAHYWQ